MTGNLFRAPIKLSPPATFILCLLLLNIWSLTCLYSSLHLGGEFRDPSIFYKQILWVAISWLVLIVFCAINYRVYYDFAYIFYGFNLLLLLAVELGGRAAMGAQRWISFGGFNFQPSELSKVAVIFLTARILSSSRNRDFLRGFVFPLVLILLNALIIFKQPDLGTALIVIFLFFAIGLISRVPRIYFISAIIIGVLASPFAWHVLKDYQKKRLIVFINPAADPLGAGYAIIQSKIAIGSGKIMGKGFLAGTQNQFNFLHERHTDVIFTVVAEEWGFFGSLFLLVIYWLILRSILDAAGQCHDAFGQLLAAGIGSLFFLHVFINMGMTLSILPVVGVPLIFMSYGGSNLIINFMLAGIFLNICRTSR